MRKKIEVKAADTILSNQIVIKIGKDSYKVNRPTLRTMIAASREISLLPELKIVKGKEASSIISYAKDSKQIGIIIATLVIGVRKNLFSFLNRIRIRRLARKVLNQYTPSELSNSLASLFSLLEIQDFFVLTTSLNEINLIKTTAEVG